MNRIIIFAGICFLFIVPCVTAPQFLISQDKFLVQDYSQKSREIAEQLVDTPHWGSGIECSSCHITHRSPSAQLTSVAGNANLCMSCHNPAGLAGAKPFTEADQAIPGVSGTSHSWEVPAEDSTFGAQPPSNPEMSSRVMSGNIVCSTCHDQHDQTYPPFLRDSNYQNAICKDCHSVRDVGSYRDNAANKGSHPVGKSYPGSDDRFYAGPQNSDLLLIDPDRVECTSCHGVHYTDSGGANGGSGDGYLLKAANNVTLCTSCHTYNEHKGNNCLDCHQVHNPDSTNIFMVRDSVLTPSDGLMPVIFINETGINSFADGDAVYDGICEVCHSGGGMYGNHNFGQNCTTCHQHNAEFMLSRPSNPPHITHTDGTAKGPDILTCDNCHAGSIYDINVIVANGHCDNCHSPGGTIDGVIMAQNNWQEGVYEVDGITLRTGNEQWCASCHDSDQASSNQDGSGIAAPDVAGDNSSYGYYYSGHGKNLMVMCTDCHDPGLEHLDGEARTYAYDQSIADLTGIEYRTGYRLTLVNGLEPMRIPLSDTSIVQTDTANYRLCLKCHDWNDLMDNSVPFTTNFNHSGANAIYSYGYGVDTVMNGHLVDHLDMQTHYGPQPFWDSDWDFNTTADQVTNVPEINGYDSRITCVTCHDVHGGRAFGGNTEGNMMRDGRLQGREPGLKFTYLIEAPGGMPTVTSVGANRGNSIGGVVRSGVDYRAGYAGTESNAICGGCHGERFPSTDEYDASGNAGSGCMPCHMMGGNDTYFIEYFRPSISSKNQQRVRADFPDRSGPHEVNIITGDADNSENNPHHNGLSEEDCISCHKDQSKKKK